jgi:TRAP-type transport system periplasmic protein
MRTHLPRLLPALVLAGTLASQEAISQTSSDTSAEQKLKELAQELPETEIRVLGIWETSPGYYLLQEPFWTEVVPELSMGRIKADLTSMTALNMSGPEVLRLASRGLTDIVDVVANYGAGSVPELDAMDLPGVAVDIETEAKALDAYAPVLKERIEEELGLVALGFGPSLGQVLWCNAEIDGIDSLQGLKIRGSSAAIADLVEGLGGVPVTMPFSEVPASLQRGVIDCAVTGTLSGNSAKLFEVTTHLYEVPFGWAAWLRAANPDFWEGLDPKVREWIELATDTVYRDMGIEAAAEATNQGTWCSTGDDRCTWGEDHRVTRADMTLVPLSEPDREVLSQAVEQTVLPGFAAACGSDCAGQWNGTIGEVTGLEAPLD